MFSKITNSSLLVIGVLVAAMSCSKNEDDPEPNNNNNNNGDAIAITTTSPEYTFWGDELTITGTGFSTVKEENKVKFIQFSPAVDLGINYTSEGGDIEIISSSQTQLKIRIPFKTETNNKGEKDFIGPDDTRIEVTVKEKKDTSDRVKFVGLPDVGTFDYHYGWYDLGGVTRIGDSVLIRRGFSGSILGAGRRYPMESGYFDKLRLKINGSMIPIKYRQISSSIQGWALYLPTEDFGEINCTEGANGWNDRGMTFEFYVEGTAKKDERELFVQYLPEQKIISVDGPSQVSIAVGGVPELTVHGIDMYYTQARFVPSTECSGLAFTTIAVQNSGVFANTLSVGIPLAQMGNCPYAVLLVDPCDNFVKIWDIKVNP